MTDEVKELEGQEPAAPAEEETPDGPYLFLIGAITGKSRPSDDFFTVAEALIADKGVAKEYTAVRWGLAEFGADRDTEFEDFKALRDALRKTVPVVVGAAGVVIVNNIDTSYGANVELEVARLLKVPVWEYNWHAGKKDPLLLPSFQHARKDILWTWQANR